MKMETLTKVLEEFKKNDDDPNWFCLTDPGERYNHKPPYSILKVDEDIGCVMALYYENGEAPGGDFVITAAIAVETISVVGHGVGDKIVARNLVKNTYGFKDDEADSYIRQLFVPKRY